MSDEWLVTARSVIGSTHIKKGMPNQDAFSAYMPSEEGYPIILAVADGHGSANYFRSDRGARFAVEAAKEVLLKFHTDTDPKDLHSMDIREIVCRNIVRSWYEKVQDDISLSPYSDDEKVLLGPQEKELSNRIMNSIRPNREIRPYGSTILASLICDEYILMVQLGDGDISIIDKSERPYLCFPNDDAIGEETFSLCLPNAEYDFKFAIKALPANEEVKLVLLSTDGYSKSYSSNEGFMKVVSDIHGYIAQSGFLSLVPLIGKQVKAKSQFSKVEGELEGWLKRATEEGSGDDITVALAVNIG